MRVLAVVLLTCAIACAPTAATPQPQIFPLRVSGTTFVDAAGKPFEWRGITAFRLAEMIAGGREREVAAYLDWARAQQLTVVRVLLMAQHLFTLSPADGRAALPRLLDLAKARGIAVEAVALADTKDVHFDIEAHVREVGRIAQEKGNAFVEIANEPGHPTQDARLHDPAFAARLAALVPEPVIVALGSLEYGEGYAAADYATTHVSRGDQPWDHVHAVADAVQRVYELKKPVISDEPIGAGPTLEPGRRDNEPARFAAAAALTRFTGMGATFHYEGGLYGRRPDGREAACLAAWRAGLALLDGVSLDGEFAVGERAARVATASAGHRVYARVGAREAAVLLVGPGGAVTPTWAKGWKDVRHAGLPGASVAVAVRDGQ
jgi:hypothetical protein